MPRDETVLFEDMLNAVTKIETYNCAHPRGSAKSALSAVLLPQPVPAGVGISGRPVPLRNASTMRWISLHRMMRSRNGALRSSVFSELKQGES